MYSFCFFLQERRTFVVFFFFSSRRRHTRWNCDWSSDVCSSDLVRHDSAMIVQVGFLSACDVNGEPSATKRFLTSCVWQLLFTTDVLGSAPMRAPPSSWMITPPAAMPYPSSLLGISPHGVPPISLMSARNVSCMCFTCRYS